MMHESKVLFASLVCCQRAGAGYVAGNLYLFL